jgi:hypothetical protein
MIGVGEIVIRCDEVSKNLAVAVGLERTEREAPVMFALADPPRPFPRSVAGLKYISPSVPRARGHACLLSLVVPGWFLNTTIGFLIGHA